MKYIVYIVIMVISIQCLPTSAFANENQYNNEYYSYDECVTQVLFDIDAAYKECTENDIVGKNCMYTSDDIYNTIIVRCGEDTRPKKQSVKKCK